MRGSYFGVAAVLFFLLACAGPGRGFPDAEPQGTAEGGGSDATLEGGAREAGVAVDGDPAEGPAHACDQVDLLFVLDDSASMADNQQSLAASVPGFLAAMRERLWFARSYHVGVVTSDAYAYNAPACRSLGDLVTDTGGPESSAAHCGPWGPEQRRYLDGNDANLGPAFQCAARVGAGGSDDERMARALLDAVDPARNAPGACNAGFARRGSLLVAVLLTDEDDVADGCDPSTTPPTCLSYGSGGTPTQWHDQLVRERFGLEQNIVVLSLLGRRVDNPCGAQVSSALLGFTNRFGRNGVVGDVCASSYDGFFNDALATIEAACRDFVVPA